MNSMKEYIDKCIETGRFEGFRTIESTTPCSVKDCKDIIVASVVHDDFMEGLPVEKQYVFCEKHFKQVIQKDLESKK